ncbi:MAG TPA: hypothetical protein VF251_03580 [Pyrinomonadaceae bacterium]
MARVLHNTPDAILSPYLSATSEAESESLLTTLLVEHADPVIRKIIGRKLHDRFRHQESEDIHGEVVTQLLERLRLCKTGCDDVGIQDFRNYVAVTTYNACYEYLRNKYPERRRLKNRLRYLLTHHAAFALWQTETGHWLGGFSNWMTSRIEIASVSKLRQLSDKPEILSPPTVSGERSCAMLVDLLKAIFRNVGAPVEFEALVNSVADLQGIKDHSEPANFEEQDVRLKADADFVMELEQRSYLRRLWSEIVQLPLRQRVALLLNLKDINEGVVMLFPLTGVATIRQIAETLAIPPDEFALLWNQLPLEDAAIAARLGLTRQAVINLRKSARARLSRRMRLIALKESNKIM